MANTESTRRNDKIPFIFFICSSVMIIFSFGMAVGTYKIFPYHILAQAQNGLEELKAQVFRLGEGQKEIPVPWYYSIVNESCQETYVRKNDSEYEGLNLVTRFGERSKLCAEIMDMNGKILHEWDIGWFKIWPKPEHLDRYFVPKSKPGTHIHGAVVMKNGDLIFNFEHLGLVRINRISEVVWRLPYQTHHSIHRNNDGNLWVCGQRRRYKPNVNFPNRKPPFDEYTILEVTPEGEIMHEWLISEILHKNGLSGLLAFSFEPGSSRYEINLDDRLHLNDAEPFPSTMEEGFFKKGDILVSLRNINTIFVFNRDTGKIKYCSTGRFIHQHDPDFIDGNRFSVFDNKSFAENGSVKSRIVIVNAAEDTFEVFFDGGGKIPFYTDIMGKHQWLPNGNLLITESREGRAFEINRRGEVVWEYINFVYQGVVGLVEEVQRLNESRIFLDTQNKTETGVSNDFEKIVLE